MPEWVEQETDKPRGDEAWNRFLVDDFLECVEVDLTTRIDYKADMQK